MTRDYGVYQKILDLYPQIAESDSDLDNIPVACKIIKNYIKLDNVITLVGTVGKGSTAHHLSGIFIHAKRSVAIYNDIFFESANECIKINYQPLSENDSCLQQSYDDFSNIINQYYNEVNNYPSILLAMQMLSLVYLSRKSLDYTILIIHQYLYGDRDNLIAHIRPTVVGVTTLQNTLNYRQELKALAIYKNTLTYITYKDINVLSVLPNAKLVMDDTVDFYTVSTSGPGRVDNLKLARMLAKYFMRLPNFKFKVTFADVLSGIYTEFAYPYRCEKISINTGQKIIFDTIFTASQLDAFFHEIVLYNISRYVIRPQNMVLICAFWNVEETYRFLQYVNECQPHITHIIFIEAVTNKIYYKQNANIKQIVTDFNSQQFRTEYYVNVQDAINSAVQLYNSDILFIGQPERLVEGKRFFVDNFRNNNFNNNSNNSNNNNSNNNNSGQNNANNSFNTNNTKVNSGCSNNCNPCTNCKGN